MNDLLKIITIEQKTLSNIKTSFLIINDFKFLNNHLV